MGISLRTALAAVALAGSLVAAPARADIVDLSTFQVDFADGVSPSLSSNFASLAASSAISSSLVNVISFDWFFQSNDSDPFDDFAGSNVTGVLASVSSVGEAGNSGWQTYYFEAPYTGLLQFYVLNALDVEFDSEFYVANVAVAPIPEPETYAMLLAGLGLLGCAVRRRDGVRHARVRFRS